MWETTGDSAGGRPLGSNELGRRSITLRDVAAAADVHVATASRALDPQSAHPVSAGTRARVQQVAEQLGYRSHLMARGLRRGRSSTVGVVVADLANPFTAPVLRGLENSLEEAGYMALVTESREDSAVLEKAVNHLLGRQVDALVLIAVRAGDRERVLSWAAKVPVVLAVRKLPGSGIPAVTHDDLGGARLVAQHLADVGHRHVLQLPGPLDVQTFSDRHQSFGATAKQLGLSVRTIGPARVPTFEEARRLMGRMLARGTGRATALFAANDFMAMGVVRALREAGLDCPGDLSVIGYNDIAMAECLDPPLTTVRLEADEVGRKTGTLALDAIAGSLDPGAGAQTPATLVIRSSTAPPRRPDRPARAAPRQTLS
jgi:LacI family transcriptional regulator